MKKLVLSLNDAPATGRTTTCELIHGLWRRQGLGHSRWHTATDQPGGPGRSTFVDLTSGLSDDEVVRWLDKSSLVMLDVASGDGASLVENFVRGDLPEILSELECTVTVLSVLNGQTRAEHSLLQLAGLLRDEAEYVVVRREQAGRDWLLPACQRAMHHLGAREIHLPDWPAELAAAAATEGDHGVEWMARASALPRMAQGLLRSWWLECDQRLEAAAPLLWPDDLDPCSYGHGLDSRGRSHQPSYQSLTAGYFSE